MGISRCQSQTLHAACHAELFRSKAFREKNLTITTPPGLRRVSAEVGCVRPFPRPVKPSVGRCQPGPAAKPAASFPRIVLKTAPVSLAS
jgi:hypothetical protein